EGIEPNGVEFALELELSGKHGDLVTISCPGGAYRNPNGLRTLLESKGVDPLDGLCLGLARLKVKKSMARPELREMALQASDPSAALKDRRDLVWRGKRLEAGIYSWERLRPGNRVEGCAVLEAVNTTYFVPQGWAMTLDQYGNAALRRCQ